MNIKKLLHLFLLLLLCFRGTSQNKLDSLCLNFNVKFNEKLLELQKEYVTKNNDTIALETFKCYISSIKIHYNDNSVFTENDSYHLLDISNPNTLQIPISTINDKIISEVVFNIGVDSIATTSGAMSGDLDPIKGMYWAWQSGYVNIKIEGKSSSCQNRNNEFQFHIGGYLKPNYAMRKIEIPIAKNCNPELVVGQILKKEIDIAIDLNKFFSEIHLNEINSVMIPGKEAMKIADLSAKIFSVE
jgi:hypothetical protein